MDGEKYERQYDKFAANLQRLTAERRVQLGRPPFVNGIRPDLFKLYKVVTALGGFEKVDGRSQWKEVAQAVGFPPGSCNADFILRKIYAKYLLNCESASGFGDEEEEIVEVISDSQPWTRSKSVSLAASTGLKTSVHTTNTSQNTKDVAEECYDSLILSLLSGLPNEVDMALNACLMMSYDDDNHFFLAKAPQLISLLLSHVGVFDTSDTSTYKTLPYHVWPTQGGPKDSFEAEKERRHNLQSEMPLPNTMRDWLEDDNLFSEGGRDWLSNDWIQFRVEQVLTIFNNLSMMEDNAYQLSQSMAYLKLLLWCINCKQSSLKQLAADCLALIAHEVVLEVAQSSFDPHLILQSLCCCLISSDRLLRLRGLEVLSKLCTVESNDDVLYTQLDERVYESILASLIVPDMELLVAALETLYQLSSLGNRICSVIITLHGLVGMLSSLLTFESEDLGKAVPKANFDGMGKAVSQVNSAQQKPEGLGSTTAPVQIQLTSLNEVSRLLKGSTANNTAPYSLIRVQLDSSQNEIETDARKWLLDSYSVDQFGSVPMMKVYSHYLNWACCKNMKQVVTIELLSKLVKSVFPASNSRPSGNEQEAVISGISSKLNADQSQCKLIAIQYSSQNNVYTQTGAGVIPSLSVTPQDETPVTSLINSSSVLSNSSTINVGDVGSTTTELNSHEDSVLSQTPEIGTLTGEKGPVVSLTTGCASKLTKDAVSHVNHCKDITSVVMANKTPVMTSKLHPSLQADSKCRGTQVAPSTTERVDGLDCKVAKKFCTLSHNHSKPVDNNIGNCDCAISSSSQVGASQPKATAAMTVCSENGLAHSQLADKKPADNSGECDFGINLLSQVKVSQPTATAVVTDCSDNGAIESPSKRAKTEHKQPAALCADTSAHGLCPGTLTLALSCNSVKIDELLYSCKNHKSETRSNCVLGRVTSSGTTNCDSSLHNKPRYCVSCHPAAASLVLSATPSTLPGLLRTSSQQQTSCNCSPRSDIRNQSLQSGMHKLLKTKGEPTQSSSTRQSTTLSVLSSTLSTANNKKQLDTDEKVANEESSVTKTIRLTAAVVIRNLLIHSPLALRKFAVVEGLLLELSQLPLEAAGVLAECLYLLSNKTECQG